MTEPFDSTEPADQLRDRLHNGAAAVDVTPDWDDLTGRLGRSYRRRLRVLGAAAAIAVAAGVAGGYVVGERRTSDGERFDASVADSAVDATTAADESGAWSPFPTTPPVPAPAVVSASGGAVFSGPSDSPYEYVPPPATRLLVRDGAGGVAVRLYRQEYPTPDYPDGFEPPADAWTPPAWCQPVGDLLAEVSTAEIAGVAYAPALGEFPPDRVLMAVYQLLGQAEQAPVGVVVAQVAADITEVRVTFPDGTVDAMAPVEGVAVLAAPAPWATDAAVTVEAVAADGTVAATETQSWADGSGWIYNERECMPPPPSLPPAGEQPADPAAAEAGVRAAVETVLGTGASREETLALIDDPSGMAEALDVLEQTYGDIASTATVDELVFTAPDRASVRYTINSDKLGTVFDRIGEVVLVDGTWKMTKASVCADLAYVGVGCDGVMVGVAEPAVSIPLPAPTTIAVDTTVPTG